MILVLETLPWLAVSHELSRFESRAIRSLVLRWVALTSVPRLGGGCAGSSERAGLFPDDALVSPCAAPLLDDAGALL